MHWLNDNAGAVQALAAVGTLFLTGFLVWATLRYVRLSSESLGLARTQLERDWRPDLRIASVEHQGSGSVYLRIANLAKPAALVKKVRIGAGGREKENILPQDVDDSSVTLLVPGGEIREQVAINQALVRYRQKHSPPPMPPQRSQWQVGLSIALVYDCAGLEHQTPWFDFSADFEDLTVTRVQWPP